MSDRVARRAAAEVSRVVRGALPLGGAVSDFCRLTLGRVESLSSVAGLYDVGAFADDGGVAGYYRNVQPVPATVSLAVGDVVWLVWTAADGHPMILVTSGAGNADGAITD